MKKSVCHTYDMFKIQNNSKHKTNVCKEECYKCNKCNKCNGCNICKIYQPCTCCILDSCKTEICENNPNNYYFEPKIIIFITVCHSE